LLIKYTKSVLWRVAKRLSYIEEVRCLKVNTIILYTFNEIILLVGIKAICVMIPRTVFGLKLLPQKILFDIYQMLKKVDGTY